MEKIPRRLYTTEFKEQAAQLVVRDGLGLTEAAHVRTRQSDGPARLRDELAAKGFHAGVGRIKRLRKHLGICCVQTRKFRATTHSNHGLPVAENLLQQDFSTERPSQVWGSDIT